MIEQCAAHAYRGRARNIILSCKSKQIGEQNKVLAKTDKVCLNESNLVGSKFYVVGTNFSLRLLFHAQSEPGWLVGWLELALHDSVREVGGR